MITSKQAQLRGRLTRLFQSKVLRATISALLLALILVKLDLGELATTLRHVIPLLLLMGVLCFIAASLISVFKWWLILRAQGIHTSFFYLVSLFYIGFFFNNFLPTNFGGDVIKVYKLSRTTGSPLESASSVFVDRASSTFALLLIAIVPDIFGLRLLDFKLTAFILCLFAISLIMIGLVSNASIARHISNLPFFRFDLMGMRVHLRNFYFSLHEFRQRKKVLATVMVISLLYQAIQNFAVYFLALSLGIHLPVWYFFIFIPIIQAISMVPFSLNGLGVREGAWVLLFSQVGVSSAEAFSMSVLSLMIMTATSLFGGVFYLFDRGALAPQAEPDQGQS